MSSFYSDDELNAIGFKSVGKKVLISKKASLYGVGKIEIGDNVRIDDFCILSGKLEIGSHIHVGASTHLFAGSAGIRLEDFVGISGRCAIYALTDDYSGGTMANAVIPDKFKKITEEKVILGRHALVGTNTTILPGVNIAEGCSVAACSMVLKSTKPFGFYAGAPARMVGNRKKDFLAFEQEFLREWNNGI